MLVYAFVLSLGLNPGAASRMGPRPVAPAPFRFCLIYLIMLFIYVEHPIKLLKKGISEKVHFRRFDLLCVVFKGCWCQISKKVKLLSGSFQFFAQSHEKRLLYNKDFCMITKDVFFVRKLLSRCICNETN